MVVVYISIHYIIDYHH